MNLRNKKILITGASFIGSHLIDILLEKKISYLRVVNLSNKHKSNLKHLKEIEFITRDLRNLDQAKKSVKNIDLVIHLAADHGGRGYVNLKQANTATNFLLDGAVLKACLEEGVEKILYASSGCVYPNNLQKYAHSKVLLKEDDVKPPYDSDNIYGWAKLMGELTLKQYYKDFGLKSAIGRFFTVYGPYATESHAVMATIAKAFVKQEPFEIWGNGYQVRNWTYVDDIVNGIILASEKIDNAKAVNLGTTERIRVIDMVKLVFKYSNYYPKKIKFMNKMPTGPINRIANNELAKKILGWIPKYTFKQGLEKTIHWYFKTKNIIEIRKDLNKLLI